MYFLSLIDECKDGLLLKNKHQFCFLRYKEALFMKNQMTVYNICVVCYVRVMCVGVWLCVFPLYAYA